MTVLQAILWWVGLSLGLGSLWIAAVYRRELRSMFACPKLRKARARR